MSSNWMCCKRWKAVVVNDSGHKAMHFCAALAFAGSLFAADPFGGRWKLDLAKTTTPYGLKSRTMIQLSKCEPTCGGLARLTILHARGHRRTGPQSWNES